LKKIALTKGHNIKMSGVPSQDIVPIKGHEVVGISPSSFKGIKPKLLVSEGEFVKIGSPLFFDKTKPEVKWASPANGKVSRIQFGARRSIEKIEINIEGQDKLKQAPFDIQKIKSSTREQILKYILEANIFHLIRQRPFNKVANPNDIPRDIFISGLNTAPLAVNLEKIITENREIFQKGLSGLSKLTNGKLYFTSNQNYNFEDVENNTISGPHPAGNVGVQIHHLKPLKPGDMIWTINAQHVITIGKLFDTGSYDPRMILSLGGSGSVAPFTAETISCVSIKDLTDNQNLTEQSVRLVSGDVLTGEKVSSDDYLGFYDSSLTIINDAVKRPFLGMLSLGSSSTKYSLTRTFLNLTSKLFDFTTAQNGELRAMVPINAWEKMLPLDILPNQLYRAILAQDIEEMEQLGIWECDDEDFALCSFSCPSKIDVGKVIRDGLDLLEAEG
jgi:Na+-transporting NADH:ubiquinone oxidoreductase subunit A